jgi:hypothetical protein
MGIEQFDQLGEIGERAGQAVDLVDHHNIDLADPQLGEKRLQGRPVERSPGKSAIIVMVGQKPPALAHWPCCLTIRFRHSSAFIRPSGIWLIFCILGAIGLGGPMELDDEAELLRYRIMRMRTALRFAADERTEAILRELIAEAEARLSALESKAAET